MVLTHVQPSNVTNHTCTYPACQHVLVVKMAAIQLWSFTRYILYLDAHFLAFPSNVYIFMVHFYTSDDAQVHKLKTKKCVKTMPW